MSTPSTTAGAAECPRCSRWAFADEITPPATIFAAYNHYTGPKDIAVYPFSGHEGGGTRHVLAQLEFLAGRG